MKILLIILGSISLVLGIIGIFLPLLPTTPFLLLTATLYLKSSPRLYNWLINQKHLGSYIENFRVHRALTLKTKIISVSLTWLTILYGICFILQDVIVRILLTTIAIGVTWHILSYKTLKKNK